MLDFYEHLALLVKKGHLDLYDVWHTFYEWAQPVYVDLQTDDRKSRESAYRDHYNDLQRMMRRMDDIQLNKCTRARQTTGRFGPKIASSSTTATNWRRARSPGPFAG